MGIKIDNNFGLIKNRRILAHQKTPFILFKRLTLRLKPTLYNKLRIYAEDNGFATITGLIRFILTEFLKDKNII